MIALLANWKRIIYGTALALLGVLLLVQTARIEGFLFIKGYAEKLADAKGQLVAIEQAGIAAAKEQQRLNKAVTDKQTEIARLTDADQENRRKLASAANAYARRMQYANNCRAGAGAAAESGAAQGGDRPDPDAVILSRKDFDILNGNTARLMDVKAWGDRMIKEGLADVYKGD